MTNTRDDEAVLRAIASEMSLALLLDEVRARGYVVRPARTHGGVCPPVETVLTSTGGGTTTHVLIWEGSYAQMVHGSVWGDRLPAGYPPLADEDDMPEQTPLDRDCP